MPSKKSSSRRTGRKPAAGTTQSSEGGRASATNVAWSGAEINTVLTGVVNLILDAGKPLRASNVFFAAQRGLPADRRRPKFSLLGAIRELFSPDGESHVYYKQAVRRGLVGFVTTGRLLHRKSSAGDGDSHARSYAWVTLSPAALRSAMLNSPVLMSRFSYPAAQKAMQPPDWAAVTLGRAARKASGTAGSASKAAGNSAPKSDPAPKADPVPKADPPPALGSGSGAPSSATWGTSTGLTWTGTVIMDRPQVQVVARRDANGLDLMTLVHGQTAAIKRLAAVVEGVSRLVEGTIAGIASLGVAMDRIESSQTEIGVAILGGIDDKPVATEPGPAPAAAPPIQDVDGDHGPDVSRALVMRVLVTNLKGDQPRRLENLIGLGLARRRAGRALVPDRISLSTVWFDSNRAPGLPDADLVINTRFGSHSQEAGLQARYSRDKLHFCSGGLSGIANLIISEAEKFAAKA